MKSRLRYTLSSLIWTMLLLAAYAMMAQAQTKTNEHQPAAGKAGAVQPSAASSPVQGSGTTGQLTKWTGSAMLGDSLITEDKFGNLGVGTLAPTSKLTVKGMIETTLGGYKFPDGTIQTTAAVGGGFAVPLVLSGPTPSDGVLVKITNLTAGKGAQITGGYGNTGVLAQGGTGFLANGGTGVKAQGGGGMEADGGIGVFAEGGNGTGFAGMRSGGVGILAVHGSGSTPALDGLAGYFLGDVQVTGNLAKGGGSFKIDHPLDPENKYLYHSFVESPDMMNIYNGNITTDANGEAIITMPDYFEALNRDFRYQLTVIGTFAQAIVADEISGNRFTIKTSAPTVKVSWQVTGVRQDAYANQHRIPVEEEKLGKERGAYLHPDAFNQPVEKSIEYVQHPELMQRLKAMKQKSQLNDNH